jgi:hypothetical protein
VNKQQQKKASSISTTATTTIASSNIDTLFDRKIGLITEGL